MAIEQTLSIIKPDAVSRNIIGEVEARLEKAGLEVRAMKMVRLTKTQAESFYDIHRGKPFYEDLVSFMTSGPCVVQVLEGENAVLANREVMGATDPQKAVPGTIRRDFAKSVDANVVHGSDSPENAKREISFFFSECEICPR
ncbi:MAG TPA: nucleoside-diphosphate kinase [Spirochaetota bacterium]|nr:nucleoside-diphosphate kinase [Spirochaetota bacterium]